MAKRRNNVVTGIAALAGLLVLGGAVSYLLTGHDPVEEEIDKLGASLKAKLGKGWGTLASTAIKAALSKTIGPELIAFAEVVHRAEQFGTQNGFTGLQTRGNAAGGARIRV